MLENGNSRHVPFVKKETNESDGYLFQKIVSGMGICWLLSKGGGGGGGTPRKIVWEGVGECVMTVATGKVALNFMKGFC